ncbi:MAG: sugar phosphate isomerase/epimerase [Oscillospiraceae bacterium]|nr:sugar phosphate isomerase/epimerase [Oscillospiraceae bacterium]
MKIGVSTASLYPLHTERALLELAERGIKTTEIFLSSTLELDGEIFASMRRTVRDYQLDVLALHPFSSPMETMFLFGSYDRRVAEMLELYKRYFTAMNELGAKIFVLHGVNADAKCDNARYLERFALLAESAREYGVTVAQENVCYCKSASPAFLQMLKRELGNFGVKPAFVLDLKQARRAGVCPFAIIDALGEAIVHLHLSDGISENTCLAIGAGDFDFARLFRETHVGGVVELYRGNYGEYDELIRYVEILEKLSKKP